MKSSVENNIDNIGVFLVLITIIVMTAIIGKLIVNIIEFLAVDASLLGTV